jgi:hypothetical protein
MFLARPAPPQGPQFTPLVPAGVVVFVFFSMLQIGLNQFGFDRDGFRSIVLSPAPRKWVLLGKSLSYSMLCLPVGVVLLLLLVTTGKISWLGLAAGLLQLLSAALLVSVAGNFVSIFLPYRIQPGSLKPTKTPAKTTILLFLAHMLFPILILPVFIPGSLEMLFAWLGWWRGVPINLLASLLLLAVVCLGYQLTLEPLGESLRRREMEILRFVTEETD